ncbi:MAG: alpha-galactosidase [Bacteroidales bacterium]|nr:alpha-galactosidase [Bacteroidales bacterium]
MERRNFIKSCAYSATGALLLPGILTPRLFGSNPDAPFKAAKGVWKLYNNGTFDLSTGHILLKGAFPSFDGKTIKPIQTKVSRKNNGGEIVYTLSEGKFILNFTEKDGILTLSATLQGVDTAPHWIAPMSEATVMGADRFFKQGNGFAGPSGVFEYPQPPLRRESPQKDESWSTDSYLTTGVIAPNGETIAIAPYLFHDYVCRSTHRNRTYRKGLIDRHLDSNINLFEIAFATENIRPKTKKIQLPDIHFTIGETPYPTFRKLASQIAEANGIKEIKQPAYHWCSWYEYEHNFNQSILDETIEGLKSFSPEIPIQTIQVDDGYSAHGDWIIANENFPQGLDHMAASITNAGYKAGIWVGPFMVMETSEVFKNHPDWILKDKEGNMIKSGLFRGITDYTLDTSHPEAFEHLRKVFRTLRSWGITYYKTDFLDWGLVDSTSVQRYTPGKTSAQYYTDVLKMIREEIGPESFWLACIAPYEQVVGFADGIRFSNDVTGLEGAINNLIPETIACQYMNGTLFLNDPDTLYLRDFNETKYKDANVPSTAFRSSVEPMTYDDRVALALWDAMTTNVIVTSDRLHRVSDDMVAMFRFLQPGEKYLPTEHPGWDKQSEIKSALRELPNGDYALLLLNTGKKEQKTNYPVKDLLPFDSAYVFRWNYNSRLPLGKQSSLSFDLKPNKITLLYLSRKNQVPPKKLTIFGIEN